MFNAKTLNLLQKCDMLYKMKTLTIKYWNLFISRGLVFNFFYKNVALANLN